MPATILIGAQWGDEGKVDCVKRFDERGNYVPNNFVVTGWAKYIRPKR